MVSKDTSRRSILRNAGILGMGGISTSLAGCIQSSDAEGAEDLGDEVPEIHFVIPTSSTNPFQNDLGSLIADNWRDLGFEVDVEQLEFEPHVEVAAIDRGFDASLLWWGGTPERMDPHTFIYDMHHSSTAAEGGRNMPGYQNPEYDEIAESQLRAVDEDERQQIVYEAQEMLARDQPAAYVALEDGYYPYNSDSVTDVDPTLGESLNSFWNLISVTPTEGNTVRHGLPSDIISLNPMHDLATPDRQYIRLIYDNLYRMDEEGLPSPWLATDDPIIEDDGLTYTIEIRDDAYFHDGEELTVEDVEFSYELYRSSPTYGSLVEVVDEISTNGNEVTFHLEEVYAPFTALVLGQMYIFPEHIWGDVDQDDLTDFDGDGYIGSGPFEFVDWERQSELQLEAFDDHFNPPNTERLIRIPGENISQLVSALEAGEIDMLGEIPQPGALDRLEDNDEMSLAEFQAVGYMVVDFNMRREPFDDRHIRRALTYAIPKQEYIDLIRDGMGTVTHTPISEHVDFWHNPDVEEFHLDMEAAEAELVEGGYGWDSSGRIHYGQ